MRLPNAEGAQVDPKKLKEYLLSESHPVGRSKAKFFHGMGFDESNFDVLGEGLIGIAQTEEIVEAEPSPHGTIYIVDGFITTPPGSRIRLRTVWIVDKGQDRPRFVTASPM
jgi:hypothetical protein